MQLRFVYFSVLFRIFFNSHLLVSITFRLLRIAQFAFDWCDPETTRSTQRGHLSTALIHAAGNGRTDCVRVLVEAGANKEATDAVCDI